MSSLDIPLKSHVINVIMEGGRPNLMYTSQVKIFELELDILDLTWHGADLTCPLTFDLDLSLTIKQSTLCVDE